MVRGLLIRRGKRTASIFTMHTTIPAASKTKNSGLSLLSPEQMRARVVADLTTATASSVDSPPAYGLTVAELLGKTFPPYQQIIFGLGRGEVGLNPAVTNRGKTTLWRNIALSLASGRPFPPLVLGNTPRKVLFLDFEDQYVRIQQDVKSMIDGGGFSSEQICAIGENVMVVAEAESEGETLTFSNPDHLESVQRRSIGFGADLIIVDTLGSAFRVRNENDTAEMRDEVMLPLKLLARSAKAAVLATDHIGKEKLDGGAAREPAHRVRGATGKGDVARLIVNLEREPEGEFLRLVCAKVKGPRFKDTRFRLNIERRWFEHFETVNTSSLYRKILEVFSPGVEIPTKTIVDTFTSQGVGERTIKSNLAKALAAGDLAKVRQGLWTLPG